MTKAECFAKIRDLLEEKYLLEECKRLLNSGGIDYERFENDYACPRIVLKVALKNFSNNIGLVSGSESDIKNLSCF